MKSIDTICAISTPSGHGAIAIVRLSGADALSIIEKNFEFIGSQTSFNNIKDRTAYLGIIRKNETVLDEVIITLFKAPNSYTGENIIEISCHGSAYIQQMLLQLFIDNGARLAKPGEFTLRAFLNKKMDLSQAEAVADLISSNSSASHKVAIHQMRGGFSNNIKELRNELMEFVSLLELELDFSEEDVEFADRTKLSTLLSQIKTDVKKLLDSFSLGNVLKHGVPVAIVGKPNVGKSTLLNVLLNEEKAIVSDIPGTTRDAIEDTIVLGGVAFRFVDTAGLRDSEDVIEKIGIEKTYEKIESAFIVLYLFDASETSIDEVNDAITEFKEKINNADKRIIAIANKIDLMMEAPKGFRNLVEMETIFISAKRKENIRMITESLLKSVDSSMLEQTNSIVSNARHYEALSKTLDILVNVEKGLVEKITTELIASDIRMALHYLGEIVGSITSEDVLDSIFSRFCIGK